MLNKVILIGRLGADPEVRYTQGGDMVVNFNLATDESYKNRSGEKVEKTEWHRVIAWGKLAEICGNYLTKGKLILIEGKLQTSTWEDKDGSKRYKTEIVAGNMKMLESRGQGQEPGPEADDQAPDDPPF